MLAAVGAAPSASRAQPAVSSDVAYGQGVHAYFAGNSTAAEMQLAQAIQDNPDDPRAYYFRALSLLRLGRTDEARTEMTIGGAIEARRPGRYAVGKSLERVQGSHRLMLEDYRRRARNAESTQQSALHRARYGPPGSGNAEALRQRVAVPLEQLVAPKTLSEWTEVAASLPSTPEPATELKPADRGATEADAEPLGDPFADDDPQPPADADFDAVDPVADADGTGDSIPGREARESGGVSAGKLVEIMGRVLRRTAPIPPLRDLQHEIPYLTSGGENDESDPFDSDGMFEPEAVITDDPDAAEDTHGRDEEDPFGSF